MVPIQHVVSISLSHTQRPPSVIPDQRPPSVIPDVRNRESMVFPCRPFSSLGVRHHGSYYSAVMLALSKGYDFLIEPRRRMDSR